jgi:hypothetical protein
LRREDFLKVKTKNWLKATQNLRLLARMGGGEGSRADVPPRVTSDRQPLRASCLVAVAVSGFYTNVYVTVNPVKQMLPANFSLHCRAFKRIHIQTTN